MAKKKVSGPADARRVARSKQYNVRCTIDPNDFFSPKELAPLLDVSEATIKDWCIPREDGDFLQSWQRNGSRNSSYVLIRGKWVHDFFEGKGKRDAERRAKQQSNPG